MDKTMKLIIYTDGASRGNPGPSGYGFVIKDSQGKTLLEEGFFLGIATNNFAEYSAVLESLKRVKESFPKVNEVNFYMDSKLVVEQLSGRYKIKSFNLKPIIERIKKLETSLGRVSYQHISRNLNFEADRMANKAIDNR